MRFTRRGMVLGMAALGVAGVLGTGIGVAQAGTTSSPSSTPAWQGRGGGPGMMMGGQGMMGGQRICFSAAATYLGLSESDLQTELRSGRTLAQVAEDRGKSVSGLQDAMVAAATKAIEANPALTAEQKKAAVEQAKQRIAAMIDRSHQPGAGMGRGGGGCGRGMGRIGS